MLNSKNTNPVQFGNYCVALVDILNQNEALRRFKELPHTEEERDQFIQAAKETFGVVDGIRNLFDSFYGAYSQSEISPPLNELVKTEIKFQGFSDTVIVYAGLTPSGDSNPINGIYALLLACGSTFLCSIAAGRPLRGGIDVGVGAEIYEGEIYGPVLSEAYRLESQIAQYPRIVIGKELISYLEAQKSSEDSNLRATFNRRMGQYCLGLLTQDVDGYPIVDYLGEEFMKRVDYLPLCDDTVSSAYWFIVREAEHWKEQKNTKLALRYALLQKYFINRIALWKDRLK